MSKARFGGDEHITPVSTPAGSRPSENVNVLRSIIAQKSTRIDDLEIEVATLKHFLEDEDAHGDQSRSQRQTRLATHAETEAELAAVRRQYRELKAQHQNLQRAFDRQQLKVERATEKYSLAKTSAKEWKAYVDRHHIGAAAKAQGVASHGTKTPVPALPPALPNEISDLDITPRPHLQTSETGPATAKQPCASRKSNFDPAARSDQSETVSRTRNSPSSSTQSKRITSSQTTEDDQPEVRSSPIKREADSDDAPVVMREVNLRRRRGDSSTAMPPPRRIKQEPKSPQRPGSVEEPVELRSEDWSSPTARSRPLLRMETSDLDAMRGTFQTPRKRKLRDESPPRARSEDRSRAILHPPLARNSSSLSDSDIPELLELPALTNHAAVVQRDNRATSTPAEKITPQPKSLGRQRAALARLSPNVPAIPRTSNKRRRISQEDAGKVSMLAEDGEETSDQITPKDEYDTVNAPASQRLTGLLENPTPARKPLQTPRRAPDTTTRTRLQRAQPQPQDKPQAQARAQAQPVSLQKPRPHTFNRYTRPRGIEKSPPSIDPASEPLRSKPKHQLRPQDFRINPAYADSEFAFVQPMNRVSKADRRCLPGCINPACCGEFLDAARNGLLPPSAKSDAQLLEDMLGPSHAEVMAQYHPSQHEDIIFQARAQEFANKHGRHRKTFERAATPPGFWRTEMPSTQEELEDRRKAEEIERIKVEGMWREAMKGGGRWLFRDE